jgi:hypothetical protein
LFNRLKDPETGEPEGWRLKLWLPLAGCSTCHAGQVALWLNVYFHIRAGYITPEGFVFTLKFLILAMLTAEFTSRTANYLKPQ